MRPLAVLALIVWCAGQISAGPDEFTTTVKPFLAKNCYTCHNANLKSGALNLESFQTLASVAANREKWDTIVHKLDAGEMPPPGASRPSQADAKTVVAWIKSELDRIDLSAKPDPGHVTVRRLNRAEYNNTIRDLLGVDLHPADDFPPDDSIAGFDNNGEGLSLSPVLMERYTTAAEHVVNVALFGQPLIKPSLVHLQGVRKRGNRGKKAAADEDPTLPSAPTEKISLTDYDETGLSFSSALRATRDFPVEAQYSFRITLGGNRPAGSEPVEMAFWLNDKMVKVFPVDPLTALDPRTGQIDGYAQVYGGQVRDYRMKLTAGKHTVAITYLHQFEGLPPRFGGPNPSKLPPPQIPDLTLLKPEPGLTPDAVVAYYTRQAAGLNNGNNNPNGLSIEGMDIGGPYEQVQGPSVESLKKIFICGHPGGNLPQDCERTIIANLARRAYRRPVSSGEVNELVGLLAIAQKAGSSPNEALGVAIQAMLVSPKFLFRIETDAKPVAVKGNTTGLVLKPTPTPADAHAEPSGAPHFVSPYELASRISYYLWNSMPDDELLKYADQGTLRNPNVLAPQVLRMLKDPKSRSLVENFGGQWLETRRLQTVAPDPQAFPDFDPYLRASMQKETELFFENVIREDRSVLDFVGGKYTFINERLARHYGIQGVKGPEFRKVDLTGTPRGGVITQGSVLTVTSYPARTSVVLRGKWIMENVLNAPVPPPPPNVPQLDEKTVGKSASLRQQMEAHRTNAVCASCHSRMDPLGFGLENFNAIGAWRSADGKFPIDSSGTLANGSSFKGPAELEALIQAEPQAFAEALTSKMLTYALGRGLEPYDKPTIKAICERLSADNYKFSALVLGVVDSMPFQMRKGD